MFSPDRDRIIAPPTHGASKELSCADLIEMGRLDTSGARPGTGLGPRNWLVQSVLGTGGDNLKEILGAFLPAAYADSAAAEGASALAHISLRSKRCGPGFVSTSLKTNPVLENAWTRAAVKAFEQSDMNATPLVVPVDTFYSYAPGEISLVEKVKYFNMEVESSGTAERYALVLGGFSRSAVFTGEALEAVPFQKTAGLLLQGESKFGALIDGSDWRSLVRSSLAKSGSIEGALALLVALNSEQGTETARRVGHLLCMTLVLGDKQQWQDLWYSSSLEQGAAFFIVGPQTYHEAQCRLNFFWGHGQQDYHSRAIGGLGGMLLPAFDIDGDGNVLLEEDLRKLHPEGDFTKRGLSAAQLETDYLPLLRAMTEKGEGRPSFG
jgi:hypothetical protein